eukprot:5993673-Alexandrium_andersonii.AAC.1
MCIRDRPLSPRSAVGLDAYRSNSSGSGSPQRRVPSGGSSAEGLQPVSYTHLRAHETSAHL